MVAWLLNAVSRRANLLPSTRNPLSAPLSSQATLCVAPLKALLSHLRNKEMALSVTLIPSSLAITAIRLHRNMVEVWRSLRATIPGLGAGLGATCYIQEGSYA